MQFLYLYHNAIALIQSPSNRHLCRLHISSFSAWANLTDKDNICFLLGCEYQRQQTYWIKQTMKEFVWKLKVSLLQKVTQATVFWFTFQKSCSIHEKNEHILKKKPPKYSVMQVCSTPNISIFRLRRKQTLPFLAVLCHTNLQSWMTLSAYQHIFTVLFWWFPVSDFPTRARNIFAMCFIYLLLKNLRWISNNNT